MDLRKLVDPVSILSQIYLFPDKEEFAGTLDKKLRTWAEGQKIDFTDEEKKFIKRALIRVDNQLTLLEKRTSKIQTAQDSRISSQLAPWLLYLLILNDSWSVFFTEFFDRENRINHIPDHIFSLTTEKDWIIAFKKIREAYNKLLSEVNK